MKEPFRLVTSFSTFRALFAEAVSDDAFSLAEAASHHDERCDRFQRQSRAARLRCPGGQCQHQHENNGGSGAHLSS